MGSKAKDKAVRFVQNNFEYTHGPSQHDRRAKRGAFQRKPIKRLGRIPLLRSKPNI